MKSILWILQEKKNAIFAILGAANFVFWGHFSLGKNAKIHKNQNSEPQNMVKCLIWHFKYPQT